jgi:glycosyltransferase involved in cell wall biosynthesis
VEEPNARNTVLLLTVAYPFGNAESFLDAELPVLTRRFSRVIVVPSRPQGQRRPLPAGVRCETFLGTVTRRWIARELVRRPSHAAFQYVRAVAREGSAAAYLRQPAAFMGIIGLNLLKYRLLKEFVIRERLEQALLYDYWLENSTLALSWLRREGVVTRAVARAHRVDLYDDCSPTQAVPFRAFNLASLDRIFPISSHGSRYLVARHPDAARKVYVSRLGVERQHLSSRHRSASSLVVSCASLNDVKRVELIPPVLEHVGKPLRWVHFGDGPRRGAVERAASRLPAHVTWRLAGDVERSRLLSYYKENAVDLFISLSSSEGLPVSMMEAISFGVPILATAVGGVPEIVNAMTGKLVRVSDTADSVADAARHLLDGNRPSPNEIIAFFEANFEAEKNFGEFAARLDAV